MMHFFYSSSITITTVLQISFKTKSILRRHFLRISTTNNFSLWLYSLIQLELTLLYRSMHNFSVTFLPLEIILSSIWMSKRMSVGKIKVFFSVHFCSQLWSSTNEQLLHFWVFLFFKRFFQSKKGKKILCKKE